jgi:hypothetical protein
MTVMLCGLALLLPSCGSRSAQHPKPKKPNSVRQLYMFPLSDSDTSLICVETPFSPNDPCITLGRLRRMVREAEAE